jgi:hypothetical protein
VHEKVGAMAIVSQPILGGSSRIGVTLSRLAGHPALLVVLATGTLLRIAEMVAYPGGIPGLDSWDYIHTALRASPVGFSYARPSGYPAFIRLLSYLGPPFWTLVIVQHLIVLALATVIYVTAVRRQVRKGVAAAGAGVVLLDARLLALEQYILSEVLFIGLVSAAVLLAARVSTRAAAASGVLLGLSTLTRTSGLCCLAVVAVGYLWGRHWKQLVACVIAFALPVLAYCTVHDVRTGQFSLTEMDGWYAYGRVGQIVDCTPADRAGPDGLLCRSISGTHDPAAWIFLPESPAWKLFGPPFQPNQRLRKQDSARLEAFAIHTVEEHPLAYVGMVLRDLNTLTFTDQLPLQFPTSTAVITVNAQIRAKYAPGFHPRAQSPAGFLHAYERSFRVPQVGYLLMALFCLGALARRRVPGRRLAALSVAVAVMLVVFAAAAAGADFRYAVPALPLLVLGTVLATAPGSRIRRAPAVLKTVDLTRSPDLPVSSDKENLDSAVRK